MFGIGSTELILIMVVALVLLGPSKLPEVMKSVAKGINAFRRMSSDVKSTLEREIQRADEIKRVEEIRKELFDDQPVATELQQEAAEAAEAAKKLEAEAAKPVETVQTVSGSPDQTAQAEAQKLVDAARAEAARLIADAQAEANKLLEAADAAKPADQGQAGTMASAAPVQPEAAVQQAETSKEAVQGKVHA